MIYITGDIHGRPQSRFATACFPEQKEMTKNDTVIICGDFGCVWYYLGESKEEKHWLDWLEDKPFTTVFVDGNHENHKRLAEYPVKEWNGGKVHEIRPHVLHLMRGEIFTIEDKKFFAFGGASSHDIQDGILDRDDFSSSKEFNATYQKWWNDGKMFRVKDVSWWEEELPKEYEMANGRENLYKHGYDVDYIITHSPSASMIALLGHGFYKQDILTRYLDEIRGKTAFKKFFCGHMHIDKAVNDQDIILYEQIVRIN